MNRRIDFRFNEKEMETLDFFKAMGIKYAETIRRALEEYYRAHHRNTQVKDMAAQKPDEKFPEESRTVPDDWA